MLRKGLWVALVSGLSALPAFAQDSDGGVAPDAVETPAAVEASSVQAFETNSFFLINDVSFGESVRVPGGLIWTRRSAGYAENYSSEIRASEAVRTCRSLKGRLPTRKEFEHLMSQFPQDSYGQLTAAGKAEFSKWFPESARFEFWSADQIVGSRGWSDSAYVLSGSSGRIYPESTIRTLSVLCVK